MKNSTHETLFALVVTYQHLQSNLLKKIPDGISCHCVVLAV